MLRWANIQRNLIVQGLQVDSAAVRHNLSIETRIFDLFDEFGDADDGVGGQQARLQQEAGEGADVLVISDVTFSPALARRAAAAALAAAHRGQLVLVGDSGRRGRADFLDALAEGGVAGPAFQPVAVTIASERGPQEEQVPPNRPALRAPNGWLMDRAHGVGGRWELSRNASYSRCRSDQG